MSKPTLVFAREAEAIVWATYSILDYKDLAVDLLGPNIREKLGVLQVSNHNHVKQVKRQIQTAKLPDWLRPFV
ncbi:unnamed protein product [Arabis nemorensis]|uniref:Uncharacterized protein n=1 Tax=Arabis nemorensis TaxID=586526 RepID=A0A565BBD0_9BRAS|nr:unnamed protein product [Arabis nemorensis]